MNLLRLRFDSLHCALLAVVVLLAVYGFGPFKEGALTWRRRSLTPPPPPAQNMPFEQARVETRRP